MAGGCMASGGMCARGCALLGEDVHGWGGWVWPGGHVLQGVHGQGVHGQMGVHAQGGMHGIHAPQPDTARYGQSMSGRYTCYWNAFLF